MPFLQKQCLLLAYWFIIILVVRTKIEENVIDIFFFRKILNKENIRDKPIAIITVAGQCIVIYPKMIYLLTHVDSNVKT